MTRQYKCKTLDGLYDTLKASYEGCNYVNRVVVQGGHRSEDYPRFTFETPEGFVQDQRTRRGTITYEHEEGSSAQLGTNSTMTFFLGEIYRHYDSQVHSELTLSAKLFMDGVPGQEEPLEFRLEV